MGCLASTANPLHHEWGLFAALIGAVAALLPFIWWQLRFDTSQTLRSALQIRSVLATVFQNTIVDEARSLLVLVEEYLPNALSQADQPDAKRSPFDNFCKQIRKADEDEFDRIASRAILTKVLADLISRQIDALIETAQGSDGPHSQRNPYGLRWGLEAATERNLDFLGTILFRTTRSERWLTRSRHLAVRFFCAAVAAALVSLPWFFVDANWSYVVLILALTTFAGAFLAGVIAVLFFHSAQRWIDDTANRHVQPDDWKLAMEQHRG